MSADGAGCAKENAQASGSGGLVSVPVLYHIDLDKSS
jgi:hypothetical protein